MLDYLSREVIPTYLVLRHHKRTMHVRNCLYIQTLKLYWTKITLGQK